jgi:anti-sigma factor RsiW
MMGDHAMQITCDQATSLVPSYLDGELTEAQAAPLRGHLLGCPGCREVAKRGKALSRWFAAAESPAIPLGFAARVARRAFAGDPGDAGIRETAPVGAAEAALLPFVLRLTALAAGLLILLAGLMQLQASPTDSDELRADDLDLVWQEIYGAARGDVDQARPLAPAPDASAELLRDDAAATHGR